MKKFLVIQTAFIGDVVLSTALLASLHEKYPEAQIDFLVRKGNETLLKGHPYIHEVLVWNKKENYFSLRSSYSCRFTFRKRNRYLHRE